MSSAAARFAAALLAAGMTCVAQAQGAYDPSRDGKADLLAALAKAKESSRPVLVIVGGDWCAPCLQLDSAMKADAAMQQILAEKVVLQKINYSSRNKNKEAIGMLPFFIGYPAMFLLDADGRPLKIRSLNSFSRRDSYDMDAMAQALLEAVARR